MITNVSLRLYSHDAKKTADFYAKVFNGVILKKTGEVGQWFYECDFKKEFKIEFWNSEINHEPIDITIEVARFEDVHRNLSEEDAKIDNYDEKKLTAKDPDGNILRIFRRKRISFMPING